MRIGVLLYSAVVGSIATVVGISTYILVSNFLGYQVGGYQIGTLLIFMMTFQSALLLFRDLIKNEAL